MQIFYIVKLSSGHRHMAAAAQFFQNHLHVHISHGAPADKDSALGFQHNKGRADAPDVQQLVRRLRRDELGVLRMVFVREMAMVLS